MPFTEIFIVATIVVILIVYAHKYWSNGEVEYIVSRIDNRRYLVRSLPNKQQAADVLASINKDMIKIVKHLRATYPDDDNYKRLYDKFDPNEVSEGSPDSAYTSYTINKSHLVICIRQHDYSFVEKNVLMYPVIHELGHMACDEVGHTEKFWKIFKHMTEEAIQMGIYQKIDFKNNPTDYCGVTIKSSVV